MTSWQPSGFSAGEIGRMQREAENRVHEMQERARRSVHQGAATPTGHSTNLPPIPVPEFLKSRQKSEKEEVKKEKEGILASLGSIMDIFGFEQDHLILMLLIFVLMQAEDTDKTLLLALCYLLL